MQCDAVGLQFNNYTVSGKKSATILLPVTPPQNLSACVVSHEA